MGRWARKKSTNAAEFFARVAAGNDPVGPPPRVAEPPTRETIREPGYPPDSSGPMPPPRAPVEWFEARDERGRKMRLPVPKPRPLHPEPQIPAPKKGDDSWKLKLRIARERIAEQIRATDGDRSSQTIYMRAGLAISASIISDMLGSEEEDS